MSTEPVDDTCPFTTARTAETTAFAGNDDKSNEESNELDAFFAGVEVAYDVSSVPTVAVVNVDQEPSSTATALGNRVSVGTVGPFG